MDVPRTRWQFRLRTLLLFVTLVSAATALTTWWVALPLRTWREFAARVEAGDSHGADALCAPRCRRFFAKAELSKDVVVLAEEMDCKSFSLFIKDLNPRPRSWFDVLLGELEIDTPDAGGFGRLQTNIQIKRGKVYIVTYIVPF
ncbi:MAG: hypothetical protein K8T25_05315 [Planctomycetia bacterium]|nr:hypothetical protein [Planctomycetia bacterium]